VPKRTDIESVLIIGAGPIVIGQACEFDYSGAQACKALRAEGYKVILVNSNPATIMTDPEMADVTYIEPVNWQMIEAIIARERPDALLPTMGGQTGLNCALDLARHGVLEKYGVEMIGASREAIDKAEDREKFKKAMAKIGLACPRSTLAHSLEEALQVQAAIGFPAVIRPSFTLGGSGGGIAYNREEFVAICERGLEASPTHELLIEESVIGWKEFEMEVVRDRKDNCIIVCSIENVDPMGVHTGDSITVAPAQTLTDKEYQIMRDAAIAVLREIGVDTGGSNVQFAVNPEDGRMLVIEMNPRVSRSSALASKATGFPIAKVAAKLAVGYTLDELRNEITGGATPASFEPSIDYIVTKVPRFAFEKFPQANDRLTTQMKSVGEVMAIGRTFQESFQKALRGLEVGVDGLNQKTTDREKLEKELKAQLAPDLLIKQVTDFERILSKSQSMKAAAEELGLKIKTYENVDARGQDASGKQVVIGPGAAELVQAAFNTRESAESDLLETPRGEYFVVRTDRVTPARIPALNEVEAKVVEAWQVEERRKLADAKVKAAVEKAEAGTDLATLAKELGLEVRTTKAVTRFEADQPNYLTQPVVQALFKLAPGKVQSVRTADGSVIVRLKQVEAVDLAKDKEALDRFGKQIDTMVANDLVLQLVAALRTKYGVTVDEAAFAAAFRPQQQP